MDSYHIDDLVRGKSVVKIDVEGAELQVLESGRKAFQEGAIDVVVVEVEHETVDSVVRWLGEQDFDCFAYGKRLPVKVGDSLPQWKGNVLCLRRGTEVYNSVDLR